MPPSTLSPAIKPATPVKSTAARVTESPGNWTHPRLDEITRRQNAATFSEKNVTVIAYNLVASVILFVVQLLVRRQGLAQLVPSHVRAYIGWAYFAVQVIPIINIAFALLPLTRRPDDFSDIPLTSSQRKLLGLPPSSAPPTPGTVYSTPPRYSRTPSLAGSPASNLSFNSSPLSAKGSPAAGSGGRGGGGMTAATASPLRKAVAGGGLNAVPRRTSLGSPSPLGASPGGVGALFADLGDTPSPTGGKRSSVGLNSKWLYDRGRRVSGSPRVY